MSTLDIVQTIALVAIGVACFANIRRVNAVVASIQSLVAGIQASRRQVAQARLGMVEGRPILRNRELMKAGDRIADGSLHNDSIH